MSRRALVALAAAGLACLSACDYDAAYRTWCYKNGCQDLPEAGDGGVLYHCDGCTGAEDVCVVLAGVASCRKTCQGFIGNCPAELDCKLAPAAYQVSMVPACLPSGASVEGCVSALDCAAGRSCYLGFIQAYRCVEHCTPFESVCDDATLQCAYGADGFPTDWGYCF